MRLRIEIDGQPQDVEVDLVLGRATVGGIELPVTVLGRRGDRVELEISGERIDVELSEDDPEAPAVVGGERYRVRSTILEAAKPSEGGPRAAASQQATPPPRGAAPAPADAEAIYPPMPGKILEVRVAEGDRVASGDLLLVLEAMKMRNEVVAPRPGVVRDLRVRPGASVRAREPMLRLSTS
ncbi:MAG TPA: biotin/lipoyl-containing protein [Thermoplasmata archaeon]|nr:biotin/lipoyl-containing protein [Thermoplasmata archaeon]